MVFVYSHFCYSFLFFLSFHIINKKEWESKKESITGILSFLHRLPFWRDVNFVQSTGVKLKVCVVFHPSPLSVISFCTIRKSSRGTISSCVIYWPFLVPKPLRKKGCLASHAKKDHLFISWCLLNERREYLLKLSSDSLMIAISLNMILLCPSIQRIPVFPNMDNKRNMKYCRYRPG